MPELLGAAAKLRGAPEPDCTPGVRDGGIQYPSERGRGADVPEGDGTDGDTGRGGAMPGFDGAPR